MSEPMLEVRRGAVPLEPIDDALRVLHLDLLERGISADELSSWLWSADWFPHLKYDDRIVGLGRSLPDDWQTGKFCDPQVLLQFPHVGAEPEITFHLDQEPEWGEGRRYRRIVGVPLSRWTPENGGLLVERDGAPEPIELEPGDAVMMSPDLPHSGGINRTGSIRYGVYFRWLVDG